METAIVVYFRESSPKTFSISFSNTSLWMKWIHHRYAYLSYIRINECISAIYKSIDLNLQLNLHTIRFLNSKLLMQCHQ